MNCSSFEWPLRCGPLLSLGQILTRPGGGQPQLFPSQSTKFSLILFRPLFIDLLLKSIILFVNLLKPFNAGQRKRIRYSKLGRTSWPGGQRDRETTTTLLIKIIAANGIRQLPIRCNVKLSQSASDAAGLVVLPLIRSRPYTERGE